jgi:hypothetical protein
VSDNYYFLAAKITVVNPSSIYEELLTYMHVRSAAFIDSDNSTASHTKSALRQCHHPNSAAALFGDSSIVSL